MKSVYEICFYGGLILTILLVIVATILFIVLKIPRVFGKLTGRSARKSIKEKQNSTEPDNSVAKKEQAKYYNQSADKIKVRETISLDKLRSRDSTTELLENSDCEETALLITEGVDKATDVLGEAAADDEITNILINNAKAKEITEELVTDIGDDDEATTVLSHKETDKLARKVKVAYNIIITNTDESL